MRRTIYDASQGDREGLVTRCQVLFIAGLLGAQGASPDLASNAWSAQLAATLESHAAILAAIDGVIALAAQSFADHIPAERWVHVEAIAETLVGYGWSVGAEAGRANSRP